jgi:ubiquinone/menaquinone biosynthesis C-methylase UbiE
MHRKVLPWVLDGIELGDEVLEVGPGPGMTTDWLRHRVKSLECLEKDVSMANSLRSRLANTNVRVERGDATAMPYEDCQFSSVLSFTMLHHIPTPDLQDRFFSEAYRVLESGGVFAGVDSLPSFLMRIFHLGDTMTIVSPDSLNQRLTSVGFKATGVEIGTERYCFSARRPTAA